MFSSISCKGFHITLDIFCIKESIIMSIRRVILKSITTCYRLERTQFELPEVDGNGSVLDSVCMLRDDLLAAKCALHGQVYIFSLEKAMDRRKFNK